jgi:hypothetical protein
MPVLEYLFREGEWEIARRRMAFGKAVLTAEITAIGEFDNQAGHQTIPSTAARGIPAGQCAPSPVGDSRAAAPALA